MQRIFNLTPRNIVLIVLAITTFISGFADQYFYPGVIYPPTTLPSAFVTLFLVFAWFRLDSTQRGYKRSPWLNVSVIAVGIIALPYYFFRSRGAKNGAVATVLMLLVMVAMGLLGVAGQYAAYYGLQS